MFNLQQTERRQFVPFLFVPAGVGILFRLIYAQTLPEQLLSMALLLFCPELARMAKVDLDNVAAVTSQSSPSPLPATSSPTTQLPNQLSKQRPKPSSELRPETSSEERSEDSRLIPFQRTVVSTIVLELLGFYTIPVSLQWGGIIIIFSQLWFNLLAKVQLFPAQPQSVSSFGLLERLPVLIANTIGLALLCLWPMLEYRLWLAIGLLTLIIIFLLVKYALPLFGFSAEQNALNTSNIRAHRDREKQ